VDPVPDPLILRKSGSAGDRTRDLCICSQKLWPLDHRGGPGRGIAVLFHDRGTRRWVSGQQHVPAAIYPRERPGTHFTGGWVGPRVGLDGRKISSPPGRVAQSLYRLSYPAHNRNEDQECLMGGKGGQCVRLTTLPPSCIDCNEIREPQPSGTLRACPGP